MEQGATEFSARLELVLKALNLSRGRLSSEAQVDKSLVSRWLRGVVTPRGHNLSALTEVVRTRVAGFNQLAWDLPMPAFAELLGLGGLYGGESTPSAADPEAATASLPPLPFGLITLARRETERRGGAYEGHFRLTHPSTTHLGRLVVTHFMIRRDAGFLRVRNVGGGWECRGWLLCLQQQLYGVVADASDDSLAFMVLNGVSLPKAVAMDGIVATTAADRNRTPNAFPVMLERIADLSDEAEADERRVDEAKVQPALCDFGDVDPRLSAHLLRDYGGSAMAAGGDPILRIPWERSLAAGSIPETGQSEIDPA